MADTENLVLEHLKRFQAGQDRIERTLAEHTQRLGRIEVAIAAMRRDVAHNEEAWAEQGVRLDNLAARIERIERRLEITE
ncbi:MAG TPA: hypothetical protein VFA48_02485 [Gammaproteobacteria bacterium]|nr:hypothetical protein [Gammaproteobacteria bacterium]